MLDFILKINLNKSTIIVLVEGFGTRLKDGLHGSPKRLANMNGARLNGIY